MNKNRSIHFILLVIFIASTVLVSCNFPVYFQPRNSSFDEAALMMIASRANLDLYTAPDEVAAASTSSGVVMASIFIELQAGSKEQLNEQRALTAEFERLAAAAADKGNQFLVNFYTGKAEEHRLMAEQVEKRRADWRRNRRFFYQIKRGVRAFGHAIGNIIDFAANALISNIKNQIDFYVSEIRAFLANPIRYTFDLSLQRQLEIIKNQLTSRLGPFFGQRAYDLLNVEQAAWNLERHLFVRKTQQSPGTGQTVAEEPSTGGETTAGGTWHGAECDEIEDEDYRYRGLLYWTRILKRDSISAAYDSMPAREAAGHSTR